jgi:hypothetical protein
MPYQHNSFRLTLIPSSSQSDYWADVSLNVLQGIFGIVSSRFRCERKLCLRVSHCRLVDILDSLFYMVEPEAEYGKRSVLITLENCETCISLNPDFSFAYDYP